MAGVGVSELVRMATGFSGEGPGPERLASPSRQGDSRVEGPSDCRLTFRASESVIGARTADGERYLAVLRTV